MLKSIRLHAERLIRKLRVRSCEVPFIIWFRERSGSTHLCSILNSHPQVVCRQEDFHEIIIDEQTVIPEGVKPIEIGKGISCYRRISRFGSQYLENPTSKQIVTQLYDIFSCPTHASGFKLKYPTQDQLYPEVMDELASLGSKLRIISLSRHNVLKQAISRQNMRRINRATKGNSFNLSHEVDHETKQQVKQTRFVVNVEKAILYARQLQRELVGFEERLEHFQSYCQHPILKITYEDLLHSEADTVAEAFGYLGVDVNARYFSHIQKATSDRLADAVENYEELATAVNGTELESML